jgi:hypothetical protein
VDTIQTLPFEVAKGIRARFMDIIKTASQLLEPIEQHMDQLLVSLNNSQNRLKAINPEMRQYPLFSFSLTPLFFPFLSLIQKDNRNKECL